MVESPLSMPRCTAVAAALAASLLSGFAADEPAPKRVPSALRDLTPATRELSLHKWSGSLNVPDPVACTVDPQGRVYVSATTRRKVGDLDIREHTMWIPDDVALTSVEDKRAFFKRELAPGKMRVPRGSLKDHNADGSIDWKDLTHHTERIYQLRDTDGDGTADKMTVFAEGFNTEVTGIAAGILYHDGWVYATIAPDLWRLKDTNDDGVADVREVVAHGFGVHIAYAGHDMHGPIVGPDGRIYWSIGDKGLNATSREGKNFAFPNEGAVMRVEPDGSHFEVYARGNRNVQEPAFNAYGDLLGVDNDADQPGERERFVYLPEGSDTGWRCNYQYMKTDSPWMREGLWKPAFEGQAAHFLPPILNYSDGPAGFKMDPGTALGEMQRGMFLLNEFPSGKMKAFRAEPAGGTYKMVDARVLNDGIMGIGMSWHPDGSLMMVDWIGGYPLDELGALWRVDAKAGAKSPLRQETQVMLAAGFGRLADGVLVARLAHADQRVRQAAQLELAKRGRKDELIGVARDVKAAQLARIHGLWGYGQLLRRNAADASAVVTMLSDGDPEIRRQVAKILGDAAAAAAKGEAKALIPLLRDASPRVRSLAAIALAKFREAAAVEPLLAMAAKDGAVPVMRQAVVTGLAACASAQQLAAQKGHAAVSVRMACAVALRRQASPLLADYLRDADPLVVAEAARGIHDDEGIKEALPALAEILGRQNGSEPITRRAINAALRVGTLAAASGMLEFVLDGSSPRQMREEALIALRAWKNPPRLDLVDGYARTIKTAAIDGILTPALDRLLALTDPGLKTLAVEIMIAHALQPKAEQVAAIVADAKAAGELRAQALKLIGGEGRSSPGFTRALDAALGANSPAPLHTAALGLLLPGQPERLVKEVPAVLKSRSLPEKQQAIALLARANTAAADALLASLGERLTGGTLEAGLKLDVAEALQARAPVNPPLAARAKAYSDSKDATSHAALLAGGSTARGREIVANHLAANCMACHAVESAVGSEVGPNLRSIGGQRDPAYLLESLISPSATIATGYGIVNVTLKNRTEVTGTLSKETPEAVTVRQFDGKMQTIPRTQIATQSPPVSIMPPMVGILQPRELRDVVAYLSSLKGGGGSGGRNRAAKADEAP